MHDSKVRSRLKAQLTKFSLELCCTLSKPLAQFVSQMLFGIQSSQDVKLSNIGRTLNEGIPLIQTEKRLSRNLRNSRIEEELPSQLAKMASTRLQTNSVLALDLGDVRKEYARKMEFLADVFDGSAVLRIERKSSRNPPASQHASATMFTSTQCSASMNRRTPPCSTAVSPLCRHQIAFRSLLPSRECFSLV